MQFRVIANICEQHHFIHWLDKLVSFWKSVKMQRHINEAGFIIDVFEAWFLWIIKEYPINLLSSPIFTFDTPRCLQQIRQLGVKF